MPHKYPIPVIERAYRRRGHHEDDERVVGDATLLYWRTSKLGLPYRELFKRGEMVRIDPGVQDIVRFFNEEMQWRTTGSCDGHGTKPAWVSVWIGNYDTSEEELRQNKQVFMYNLKREFFQKSKRRYYIQGSDGTRVDIEPNYAGFRVFVSGDLNRGWTELKLRLKKWFG